MERVSMEAYTLPSARQTASVDLLCDSGNSNWGSVALLPDPQGHT